MNINNLGLMPRVPGPPQSETGRLAASYLNNAANITLGLPNPMAGARTTTTTESTSGNSAGDVIGESLGLAVGALGGLAEAGLFSL